MNDNELHAAGIDLEWFIADGLGNHWELHQGIRTPLIINAAITGMMPRKSDTPHRDD